MARDDDVGEYEYRGRDAKSIHERATQSGGSYDNWTDPRIPNYKVRDGRNEIRIIEPTWVHDDDMRTQWGDNWCITIWLHYNIGPEDNSYLCRNKVLGERCYLCEATAELRKTDEKAAKEIQATKRTLVFLIDRKDEEQGPQLWGMPWKKVETEIQYRSENTKTGALLIDHREKGYDVSFNKSGQKDRTDYTGVEIARESSPLCDNQKTQKQWIQFVKDNPLPKTLIFYPNDYLEAIFNGRNPRIAGTVSSAPAPNGRDEQPSGGRVQRSESKEKELKKLSSDDVDDLDRNGLEEAIKDYKLDVDGDDFKKTSDLRGAVRDALKKAGYMKGVKDEHESPSSGRVQRSESEPKRLDAVPSYKLEVMERPDLLAVIKEYKLDIDPEDYPKDLKLMAKIMGALKDKDLLDEAPKPSGGGRVQRSEKKLDPINQDRLDDMELDDLVKLVADYGLDKIDQSDPLKTIRKEVRASLKDKKLWEEDSGGASGGGDSASRAQASIDRMKNKTRE